MKGSKYEAYRLEVAWFRRVDRSTRDSQRDTAIRDWIEKEMKEAWRDKVKEEPSFSYQGTDLPPPPIS